MVDIDKEEQYRCLLSDCLSKRIGKVGTCFIISKLFNWPFSYIFLA